MKRQKSVMLASPDSNFCLLLEELLQQAGFSVQQTADGLQARSLLESCVPDVLVLDLMLPGLDGFTLLRAIPPQPRPQILLMSAFVSDYIAHTAAELGVRYFMVKPCDVHAVADHVKQLCIPIVVQDPNRLAGPKNLEWMVELALRSIGISSHLSGYSYLKQAVVLAMNDRKLLESLTKQLYPQIAKACGTTVSRAERCMRSAIATAWQTPQSAERQENRRNLGFEPGYKPTNGELVAALSDHLRYQIQMTENEHTDIC